MSTTTNRRHGSVGEPCLLRSTVLSILLFWLPVIRPVHRRPGRRNARRRASATRYSPPFFRSVIVGALLALVGIVVGLPILGALFATIGAGLIAAHSASMLAGALIGAAIL